MSCDRRVVTRWSAAVAAGLLAFHLFTLDFRGPFPSSSASAVPAPDVAAAAKSALEERAAAVEEQAGALMQLRWDTPGERSAYLELQIDLNLIARWLLTRAAAAPPGSEMQVCAYLRALNVLAAADAMAGRFQELTEGPDEAQAAAMGRVNELTFRPGELRSVAELDQVCAALAQDLLEAAGPLGAAGEELPEMRPVALDAGTDYGGGRGL